MTPDRVRRTSVTSVDRCTGEVRAAEIWPGSAVMPAAGTPGRPRTKLRTRSRANCAEVEPLRLGQDSGEEGVPDVAADGSGDAGPVQGVGQADVLAGQQPLDAAQGRCDPRRQPRQLPRTQVAAAERAAEQPRCPERVSHDPDPVRAGQRDAGGEPTQLQRPHVDQLPDGG